MVRGKNTMGESVGLIWQQQNYIPDQIVLNEEKEKGWFRTT